MRTMLFFILGFFCVSLSSGQEIEVQPAVDGVFNEWSNSGQQTLTDPVGDATGAFDIKTVTVQDFNFDLYLNLELDSSLNLQSGPKSDRTLKIDLDLGDCGTLLIDFRGRTAALNKGDSIRPVPWQEIDFVSLPTYAADRFEMRLKLRDLGVQEGDVVKINFSGSDELDKPIRQIFSKQSAITGLPAKVEQPTQKADFRIANINTLRNGLIDKTRGPLLRAAIESSEADIVCVQEEWKKEKFDTGVSFLQGELAEHVIWFGGCGILSRHPIERLPMTLDRAVAGLVTFDDGRQVTVISVHFKAAGFAGSKEDKLRIQQATQLVSEIEKMRNQQFGKEAMQAPVIVIGDYNLVGSRKPLDILLAAGLSEVLPVRQGNGFAHTWQGLKEDESFWPGRLDLLTQAGLKTLNAEVMESETNRYSDHFMLVGEFAFPE